METKSIFENISGLKENLKAYLETKISYYALKAFEKVVKTLTVLVANGFVLLLLWMSLIFFSGAAGLYIGRLLDSMELGLLIMGGFYLLLGIVFFIFRKHVFSRIIINILVNVFFKDDDDEDEDNFK